MSGPLPHFPPIPPAPTMSPTPLVGGGGNATVAAANAAISHTLHTQHTTSSSSSSSSIPPHTTSPSPQPGNQPSLTLEERFSILEEKLLNQVNSTMMSLAANNTLPMHNPHRNQDPNASVSFNSIHAGSTPAVNLGGSKLPPGVKLQQPQPFSGQIGVQAMSVLMFVKQMELYLKAAKVNVDSEDSLDIAVLYLRENALIWYHSICVREVILSWNVLKAKLEERFMPKAQAQINLNSLLKLQYGGSIERYNQAFMKYLLLDPSLSAVGNERIVMGIYSNRITGPKGSFAAYLQSEIQRALNQKQIVQIDGISIEEPVVKSVYDLMDLTLLWEQSAEVGSTDSGVNKSRSTFPRYGATASRSSSSSSSSAVPRYRSPFRTPFKRPFERSSPIAKPSFNHIRGAEDDAIDNDGYGDERDPFSNDPDPDYDDENSELHFHGNDDTGRDSCDKPESDAADNDDGVEILNAIRRYEAAKGVNPKLSPDEFDRRKRAGVCFGCQQDGHYIRNCPKNKAKQRFQQGKGQ
jgi:hypothetical protein